MKDKLKEEAKAYSMCDEYFVLLDSSKRDLVKLYMTQPNECMSNGFPSLDLLENHFNDEEIRKMGVYISQDLENLLCNQQVYVFNNCTGSINVEFDIKKAIYPMLYIGHGSNLKITINNSKTPIYVFDTATISLSVKGNGKATVIRYNKNNYECKPEEIKNGNIKIRDIDG